MAKKKAKAVKKLSDYTRSDRRRAQKHKSLTPREMRWDHACLVIQSAFTLLSEAEDKYVLGLFRQDINRVRTYLKNREPDEQIIMNSIMSGAWLLSEISEETGLPIDYIKQIVSKLCLEKKIKRDGNLFRPI